MVETGGAGGLGRFGLGPNGHLGWKKRIARDMKQLVFFALASLLMCPALAEGLSAKNAAGERLATIVETPPGDGPFPAVVLAPGQGYHMSLPALEKTAQALVNQGIAVVRFNWAYFTAQPRRQPSEDLSLELQDLQAVIAATRAHPKVLAGSITVGGKSLGSLVAWQAFRRDPELKSVLLLTPVCSRATKGVSDAVSEAEQNYPGFRTEVRPSLWVSGNKDPFCPSVVLYSFVAFSKSVARVAIVGGDHSYEDRTLPAPEAEVARQRNLAVVGALAAGFVGELARGRT